VSAAGIMLVLSLLLFWLPLAGPFIAGFVGGRRAGNGATAVTIALLPAILLGGLVALVLSAVDLPVLGTLAGIGVFVAVLVQDIPLLLGAYAGAET
jgi:hypothetical protein